MVRFGAQWMKEKRDAQRERYREEGREEGRIEVLNRLPEDQRRQLEAELKSGKGNDEKSQ